MAKSLLPQLSQKKKKEKEKKENTANGTNVLCMCRGGHRKNKNKPQPVVYEREHTTHAISNNKKINKSLENPTHNHKNIQEHTTHCGKRQ